VRLEPVGAGTERVEEVLRQHFPHIRVGRFDSDAIRGRSQAEALVTSAGAGDIDVLVGTKMLFLHRMLPRAGVVAVLNADVGLHMPDFRSAEWAYHTLQDAVSLADTKGQGKVLIQTYLPQHHVIEAVVRDKPSLFLDTELAFRETLQYPPFTSLVRLDVTGASERHVRLAAERWAAAVQGIIESEQRSLERPLSLPSSHAETSTGRSVSILGPAPAPRLRRRYHWRLLVRSPSQEDLLRVVRQSLPDVERLSRAGDIRCSVDVDPVTML
jgi:primosomal protein N' (replication factor Y)